MIEDQFGGKWRIRAYLLGWPVTLKMYALIGRFFPEQYRSVDVSQA